MHFRTGMIVVVLGLGVAVSGCARKAVLDPGPDEFLVLPKTALSEPASYADLPAPRGDGVNRADTNPIGTAIRALGGDPSQATRQLGSVSTAGRSGGGIFGFLRKRTGDVLDPAAEAERLRALGIPVGQSG